MVRSDRSVGDFGATVFALGSRPVRTADVTGCQVPILEQA